MATLLSVTKVVPIVVDVLLVVLFCVIGRTSHDEAILTGLLRTVWPFAAGLGIGWLITVGLHLRRPGADSFDPIRVWPAGLVIWACTLGIGMVLRAVSGQGTATSFVFVAGGVLALFLVGWRVAIKAIN